MGFTFLSDKTERHGVNRYTEIMLNYWLQTLTTCHENAIAISPVMCAAVNLFANLLWIMNPYWIDGRTDGRIGAKCGLLEEKPPNKTLEIGKKKFSSLLIAELISAFLYRGDFWHDKPHTSKPTHWTMSRFKSQNPWFTDSCVTLRWALTMWRHCTPGSSITQFVLPLTASMTADGS